jgi:hypothetical protein
MIKGWRRGKGRGRRRRKRRSETLIYIYITSDPRKINKPLVIHAYCVHARFLEKIEF